MRPPWPQSRRRWPKMADETGAGAHALPCGSWQGANTWSVCAGNGKLCPKSLWQQAQRYTRPIATIPFVRMVGITGSLAMNNARSHQDDIDLLIVTARNRVWLARGLVILIVHLARRFGVTICPNYVMAQHCLEIGEPSLFFAHELAQLVPLYGLDTYCAFAGAATPGSLLFCQMPHRGRPVSAKSALQRRLDSGCSKVRWVAVWATPSNGWERERKIPRLRQAAGEQGGRGTCYTPDLCKGHADDHAAASSQRYAARLAAQEP